MENKYHVHVYVNDEEISDYCISYTREQKICTGVGNLTIVFEPNVPHEFIPYDHIVIEENGNTRVGSYYVSTIGHRVPGSEIEVYAQDGSKMLTDHFISDQWIIDYPSYSLYWIEYFLTDAQVEYEILDPDSTLLSYNTQLGMVSNYEQIINLLQMNGWYMYFDSYDKCHIGPLNKDFSTETTTLNPTDLLYMDVVSHDKMLRNRVLVLGAADPAGSGYISAEIIRHTPWDYDNKDIRSVVISNSAIPTQADAAELASTAINEFAQITVEKHMQAWGAYYLHVGDIIRVRHDYFSGKGMVTTFGTEMSKDGLKSNVVLDERCPRLFGFFRPDDLVYAATFGDGVYAKQLHIDPNWYDVSSGIPTREVTDLHVANGIFGAIGSKGEFMYADSAPIISYVGTVNSGLAYSGSYDRGNVFQSMNWVKGSLENLHPINSGITDYGITYSGLNGRAVIVDRLTNRIKVAADTRPVPNMGDYMMATAYSGIGTLLSGMVVTPIGSGYILPTFSGEFQSCIIDMSPIGTVGTVYPIKLTETQASGIYGINITDDVAISGYRKNISIHDIDTDSITDYVSIGISTSGLIYPFSGHAGYEPLVFNPRQINPAKVSTDTIITSLFYQKDMSQAGSIFHGNTGNNYPSDYGYIPVATFDTADIGQRDLICSWYQNDPTYYVRYKRCRVNWTAGNMSQTVIFSPLMADKSLTLQVVKSTSDTLYTIYGIRYENFIFGVYKDTWDVTGNTLSRETLYEYSVEQDDPPEQGWQYYGHYPEYIYNNGKYHVALHRYSMTAVRNGYPEDVRMEHLTVGYLAYDIDNETLDVAPDLLIEHENNDGNYYLVPLNVIGTGPQTPTIGVCNDTCQIILPYTLSYNPVSAGDLPVWEFHIYEFFFIPGQVFNDTELYNDYSTVYQSEMNVGYNFNSSNATPDRMVYSAYFKWGTGNDLYLSSNGINHRFDNTPTQEYYQKMENIVPVHGRYSDGKYFALHYGLHYYDEDKFTLMSSEDMLPIEEVTFSPGYHYLSPFINRDTQNNQIMWLAWKEGVSGYCIVETPIDATSSISTQVPFPISTGIYNQGWIKTGNFVTGPGMDYYYYDGTVMTSGYGTIYLTLQRQGEWYNIIKSGIFPDRVEISNFNPLVTLDRTIDTMGIYNLSASGITPVLVPSISSVIPSGISTVSGLLLYDYRYADFMFDTNSLFKPFDPLYPQGFYSREIFWSKDEGVFARDAYLLNPISGIITSDSGIITRVESTNNYKPDQYMFFAISGITNPSAVLNGVTVAGQWGFYQKDPAMFPIEYSSGYPASRTTVIRIDERI